MSTKFEAGQELKGKVTGIQPYGAFVALDENTQGLVHISEVTHGFVNDINDHLSVGQEVNVKVLSVDENAGKYSLSIRATEEAPEKPQRKERRAQPSKSVSHTEDTTGFNSLKDKLQEWIDQSDMKR
ncbi:MULTISPECIES: S1 domain-containing post-transcriptional regulator GSP13 [Jeotgalibacillus]|uniref:General stress protein 13 n=4 Tax=Jeotgalibacillus TaxID=157226 RepID=A0A0C2VSB6_9BACL|nr:MULTISPECIES: S1 domain-containing post-transcriptional regulator GSP13 [Jeotgalibacillus]AJD91885.1 general stress protein 13 [Jeotgalibacillus malaysiensis]KIL46878.1 general stress protein 13 [Jeotgalibacillus alimentarius]MBM7580510.1 general stress protein 13 [Jeotgalibacillus terrae]MDZ5713654.1 S1 domain-containing post-transcriptional regulator GSP13 [Jeotgalibacillus sp. HH7-29]